MRRPSERTFEAFYNVFHIFDSTGEPFPTLGGSSAKVLDERCDLMAFHRPAEEDRVTQMVRQHFPLVVPSMSSPSDLRLAMLTR